MKNRGSIVNMAVGVAVVCATILPMAIVGASNAGAAASVKVFMIPKFSGGLQEPRRQVGTQLSLRWTHHRFRG